MAFCLGRPGLNPRLEFGFFQFRIAVTLFSLVVRLFLITCKRAYSSFFFTVSFINCKLTMYQEKGKAQIKKTHSSSTNAIFRWMCFPPNDKESVRWEAKKLKGRFSTERERNGCWRQSNNSLLGGGSIRIYEEPGFESCRSKAPVHRLNFLGLWLTHGW